MEAIDPTRAPSRRTLSSWEHDDTSPTVAQLTILASALDFPVESFVVGLTAPEAGPDDGPGLDVYPPWDSNPEPAGFRRDLRLVA